MAAAVDELVVRMAAVLAPLEGTGDPARFFLGTYLRTTQAIGSALDRGLFEDPGWVGAWDVDFAVRYLDALAALRAGDGAAASVPRPWQLAFGADVVSGPEAHVLLGMNAHINFDLPLSLVAMIPPEDFGDPWVLARRRRDHERIDAVLAERVAAEDGALQRAGGRRTLVDRLLTPANRTAARTFLREARHKVWANTQALNAARLDGPQRYAARVAELEDLSAARVRDLLRPGPVLLRLALHGFGVTLAG